MLHNLHYATNHYIKQKVTFDGGGSRLFSERPQGHEVGHPSRSAQKTIGNPDALKIPLVGLSMPRPFASAKAAMIVPTPSLGGDIRDR